MNPKQRAADAAVDMVQSGMVVGLGTGSTADLFITSLAAAIALGRLSNIRGIPTSNRSDERARQLKIPIITLGDALPDLTFDGADEISPNLDLIKGLGGALLREKMIAQNSKKLIIIADESKLVPTLGAKCSLPVEVIQFEHQAQAVFLRGLGAKPVLRTNADGKPFVSDNGNLIYDAAFGPIADPEELLANLAARAGIVECGLFLEMARMAIIGTENGVRKLTRNE